MRDTFSQEFCSVVPCTVGGRIIAGQRLRNCLVQVKDAEMALGQVPGTLVAQVPAAHVQIITPAAPPKAGTAVVVRLGDGAVLAVEFGGVYRRQQRGNPLDRGKCGAITPAVHQSRTCRASYSM